MRLEIRRETRRETRREKNVKRRKNMGKNYFKNGGGGVKKDGKNPQLNTIDEDRPIN